MHRISDWSGHAGTACCRKDFPWRSRNNVWRQSASVCSRFLVRIIVTMSSNSIRALDKLTDTQLLSHVTDMGQLFKRQLKNIKTEYPDMVVDVRGRGLMVGMELSEDPSKRFIPMMQQEGVLFCSAGHNTVRFVPPLILSESDAHRCLEKISLVLQQMHAQSDQPIIKSQQ
jgi:hypothetical protein